MGPLSVARTTALLPRAHGRPTVVIGRLTKQYYLWRPTTSYTAFAGQVWSPQVSCLQLWPIWPTRARSCLCSMLAQVLRCTSCAGDLEAHPPTRSPSNRWLCATHIGQQSCRHRLRVKKARSASPFSRSIMLPLNLREDCPRRRRQEWIWSEPLGRAARPSSTAQTPTATGPPWDTTAAIAEAFLARGARTDGRARFKLVLTWGPCAGLFHDWESQPH
jgi:hypothetical protein